MECRPLYYGKHSAEIALIGRNFVGFELVAVCCNSGDLRNTLSLLLSRKVLSLLVPKTRATRTVLHHFNQVAVPGLIAIIY